MELKALRYFLAAAKEGNITRAASQLYISQPTLTRQIQSLEAELGVKLFQRTNYAVKLTDDGRALARRAETLIELADKTVAELKASKETPHGIVFAGATREESVEFVTDSFAHVLKEYPGIRLNIFSAPLVTVRERLDNGLLDFAQTGGFPEIDRYVHFPLNIKDTYCVLMRRDDPLARRASFETSDLCNMPLICSQKWIDQGFPDWLENVSEKLKLVAVMNMAYYSGALVRKGIGYAILPGKLTGLQHSDLCFRPIEGAPTVEMHLIYRKNTPLSPQADILVEKLREAAEANRLNLSRGYAAEL